MLFGSRFVSVSRVVVKISPPTFSVTHRSARPSGSGAVRIAATGSLSAAGSAGGTVPFGGSIAAMVDGEQEHESVDGRYTPGCAGGEKNKTKRQSPSHSFVFFRLALPLLFLCVFTSRAPFPAVPRTGLDAFALILKSFPYNVSARLTALCFGFPTHPSKQLPFYVIVRQSRVFLALRLIYNLIPE